MNGVWRLKTCSDGRHKWQKKGRWIPMVMLGCEAPENIWIGRLFMVLFLSLQSVHDTGQVKILLHWRRRASNTKSQDQFCCWDHVVLSEPTGHSHLAMCNASPSPPSFCVSLEKLRSSQDGLHSHSQSLLSFLFYRRWKIVLGMLWPYRKIEKWNRNQ